MDCRTQLACVRLRKAFYCTVNPVELVIPPEFAVMLAFPAALQCARPATLGAFAMVATLALEELQ